VKASSNGFRDVDSAGVWQHSETRAISRLHVRIIATRLRLLRRMAAQEKMNAGGTASHQHGADTRFLSCPDVDTRHRPHLIIHALQRWPYLRVFDRRTGATVQSLKPREPRQMNEASLHRVRASSAFRNERRREELRQKLSSTPNICNNDGTRAVTTPPRCFGSYALEVTKGGEAWWLVM
jgi:hypothetical protein